MKHLLRHRILVIILLFAVMYSSIFTPVFAAAYTNSMKLGPASGTSQPGQTFTVSVDGAVGWSLFSTVNLSGTIMYPKNLLKVESIDKSNSTFFSANNVTDNKAGTITFNQGNWLISANNQPIHMFIITFRSLANGSAAVNFGSAQYNSGTATTTGATYTISSPAPTPTPTPTPTITPKPTTTPKPSTSPTASKPTTTPITITPTPTPSLDPEETPSPSVENDGGIKIENVKKTITRQENSISWTINKPDAPPKVSYGTSKDSMKSQATVINQDDGSYKATFSDLKSGTLYYFSIKAATPDNLQGTNYTDSFVTRGYPVQLTVQQNNLLIPGAKVKINNRTFTANKNAIITTELGDGEHEAIILASDSVASTSIKFVVQKKIVPASGNPELQSFVLNSALTSDPAPASGSTVLLVLAGAVGLIVVAGVIGFIIYKRRIAENSAASSIDADILTTNYGPALSETHSNTPEPNLDMTTTFANKQTLASSVPTAEMTPISVTQNEQPLNAPIVTQTPQPATEPAATPDPLVTNTDVITQPEQVIYDEQLSAEVAQVESAEGELTEQNEPSAVYDEATGELDIIHHHAQPAIQSPAVQNTPPNLPLPPQIPYTGTR